MKSWIRCLALLLVSTLSVVHAFDVTLNQNDRLKCSGMYSRNHWDGDLEPFIKVDLGTSNGNEAKKDRYVRVVILDWKDAKLIIGSPSDATPDDRKSLYDDETIRTNLLNATLKGEFIFVENVTALSSNYIRTEVINLKQSKRISYPATGVAESGTLRTGYYCVATAPFNEGEEYTAIVTFRNAYGELPADQIGKLSFYRCITTVCFAVGCLWVFLYVKYQHNILSVQKYITAILIFLFIEMLMTYELYDYQNRYGNNLDTKALTIIVAGLRAFKILFWFFLLVIEAKGYGIVELQLGKEIAKPPWLIIAHAVFTIIVILSGLLRPDSYSAIVMVAFASLPLCAILIQYRLSLNMTVKGLEERKQNVKADMYTKFWGFVVTSIVVVAIVVAIVAIVGFVGFFLRDSSAFALFRSPDLDPTHWQTRWFGLNIYLDFFYLVTTCFAGYTWRPRANNKCLSRSVGVAQAESTSPEKVHMYAC